MNEEEILDDYVYDITALGGDGSKAKNRLANLIAIKEIEFGINTLKNLKEEYHNNIVSEDRMDMEIDEHIADLEQQLLKLIGEK